MKNGCRECEKMPDDKLCNECELEALQSTAEAAISDYLCKRDNVMIVKAAEAATTGERKDLQEYQRLRKKFELKMRFV